MYSLVGNMRSKNSGAGGSPPSDPTITFADNHIGANVRCTVSTPLESIDSMTFELQNIDQFTGWQSFAVDTTSPYSVTGDPSGAPWFSSTSEQLQFRVKATNAYGDSNWTYSSIFIYDG